MNQIENIPSLVQAMVWHRTVTKPFREPKLAQLKHKQFEYHEKQMQWLCYIPIKYKVMQHIDGLMQRRRNSSALAMELRVFCTKPSIYPTLQLEIWWYGCCLAPIAEIFSNELYLCLYTCFRH